MNDLKKIVLSDLIELKTPLSVIRKKVKELKWDSTNELIFITKEQLIKNIDNFIESQNGLILMEQWADLVECREDIGFETNWVKEAIHDMANPILSGLNTKEKLKKLKESLLKHK